MRDSKRSIEAAVGFGGNRLILDESSLIDDVLYARVKRMLGGYDDQDTFLLEMGTPFYRNHFFRTWHSERYYFKLFVDYHQIALKEGRCSQAFIDEMCEEAFFDVFYECRFPEADEIDEYGYHQLLTTEQLEAVMIDELPADLGGARRPSCYRSRHDPLCRISGSQHLPKGGKR